jgi:hypothetical protein
MLIDYSIRAFEALERKLSIQEKGEVFKVFTRVGNLMKIEGLPSGLEAWEHMRTQQLQENFEYSSYTKDLFIQYKKHLGNLRYRLMLEAQTLIAPKTIMELLNFRQISFLYIILPFYSLGKLIKADYLFKELLLPKEYKKEIKSLDESPTS